MSYTDISIDDYITHYQRTDHYLIDVREEDEYADGHLPGAVNLPLSELEQRYREIQSDKPIVLVCARGGRSAQAAEYLAYQGYQNLYNLEGGTLGYIKAGHPVEK